MRHPFETYKGKRNHEPQTLDEVAKALKVPVEQLRIFDEEAAIHNIQNNYDSAVINVSPAINYKCTFNPIDKVVELYERMIKDRCDD